MRHKLWLTFMVACLSVCIHAQGTEFDTEEESLPMDEKNDMSTLFDRSKSVDINIISKEELITLGASPIIAERIVFHRQKYGEFIDLFELQSVQGMNQKLFEQLREHLFVEAAKPNLQYNPKTSIRIRASPPEKDDVVEKTTFVERTKILLSAKHEINKDIKVAAIFEKDQGEALHYKSKEFGPDYSSGYISFENISPTIKQLIIGDFSARFGQGLLINNQYRRSNSFQGHVSKLVGKKIKPYGSINENGGFRGISTMLSINDTWEFQSFFSAANRDATLYESENMEFYTLSTSGLHTTNLTKAKRDLITEYSSGFSIGKKWNLSTLNLNWNWNKFSKPIRKPQDLILADISTYKQSSGMSIDHNFFYKNFNWYGETAIQASGTCAMVHGLMFSPHSSIQGHLVARHYPANYHLDHFQAFGHSSKPRNENGLFASLKWAINTKWSAYLALDHWYRPRLSYQNDGNTDGQDLQLTLRKKERKKYEFYFLFKLKQSEQFQLSDGKTHEQVPHKQWSLRSHCSIVLFKGIEFRTRVEINNLVGLPPFANPAVLSFADFIYKPIETKLSFTARVAAYDIPNFERRIYSYENNLTHVFSIPFYSGKGLKYYLNAKYRFSKVSLEGRVEYITRRSDDEPISILESKAKYSFQATFKI